MILSFKKTRQENNKLYTVWSVYHADNLNAFSARQSTALRPYLQQSMLLIEFFQWKIDVFFQEVNEFKLYCIITELLGSIYTEQ